MRLTHSSADGHDFFSPRRHEDSRREKKVWRCAISAVAQSLLACMLPDILHAKAQRANPIGPRPDCRGNHSRRALPFLFLLRASVSPWFKSLVAADGCSRPFRGQYFSCPSQERSSSAWASACKASAASRPVFSPLSTEVSACSTSLRICCQPATLGSVRAKERQS